MEVIPGETLEQYLARCSDHYQATMAAAVAVVETVAETMAVNQEQAAELPGELFEQAVCSHPRVDREAGVINRAHVLGTQSKHGYAYSVEAMRPNQARFEGMAVGIDHDYAQKPLRVEDAWGTLRNITVDDKGVWGDLHYLKSHVRTEQILEDIERGTGLFALSCVNARVIERDKVVTAFLPTRVDLVAGGATTKTVLEQAPIEPVSPAVNPEELAALKAEVAALKAAQTKFEQFQAAHAHAAAAVVQAESLDLKKFWNE